MCVSTDAVAESGSSLSLWSDDSFLSIASEASVLSIGSFLSVASVLSSTSGGSALSHLSVGGVLAEHARSEDRAMGVSTALAAIALVGAGRAIRRRLGS